MAEYLDYEGLRKFASYIQQQMPTIQAVSLTANRSVAATTNLDLQDDEASYDTATTFTDENGHVHSQLLLDNGKTATNIYAWGDWIGHNGGLYNYSSGKRSLIVTLDNKGTVIPSNSIVRIDHSSNCGIALIGTGADITSTGNALTIFTTKQAIRLGLMFARGSYVYSVTIFTPNGDKTLTVTQRDGSKGEATIASSSRFADKKHQHLMADITDHPEPLGTSEIETLIGKYL